MRHRDAASGEWATGGAKLLAQATAAQLGMLITTTRWTGPTCCWKTVAMAGEWTAAGTATGRAVLMVPVGAVAMRRRAGGCSWRSRGSREPRDGLGGDSQHLLRFGHSTSYPPSFWSQHSFVLVTTYFILLHYKTRLGQPSSGRWEEGKEGENPWWCVHSRFCGVQGSRSVRFSSSSALPEHGVGILRPNIV